MKSRLLLFGLLLLAMLANVASTAHAADETSARRGPNSPFTEKEIRQGYRERVLLARPHPSRRASIDAEEKREGIRVRERFARFRDLRVIDVDANDDTDAALRRLRASGRYDFVEPDYLRHIAVEPNDPRFLDGTLWALRNTGLASGIVGADIKAANAWDLVREASNIVVAVIDTGVNLAHQDLQGNLWRNPNPTFGDLNGASFVGGSQTADPSDENGHGTHVAGTIGAVGNNGIATAGVAWRVQIMAVKVFPATGSGSVSDIARGVNYAVQNGAHIINASYGALGNSGFSNTELAAITAARDAGVLFVAAAGNSGANMDVSRFFPANHALDNIVTVGNSNRRDELALSSNYGSPVDIFAPGSEIVSLSHTSNTGTISLSGTSMAAPHVSGALALLKAQYPADTYRQLINRLLRGADPGERFAGRSQTGGRLNLDRALRGSSNRPFNDDFASRPRFTSNNLNLRSSNESASAEIEAGEPAHADLPASSTLWWEWVPPFSGTVTVHTSGSSYDTVLAVYSGTTLGGLTRIEANDNDPSNATTATSRLSFNAQGGVRYQIAVGGKNGATGLTLLNLGTTPANDAFAAAATLVGESTRVTATNANSSREAGEPRILNFAGGTSLWYRWTAPRSGRFQVAAVSNDFDPLLAVYTGDTLSSLMLVTASDNTGPNNQNTGSLCTLDAVAGTTYRFTVDSKSASAIGLFTLTVSDSLWQVATGSPITGAPAIGRDGTIYFGGIDRSIYAVAPDGTVKWSVPTGGLIDTCSPAMAEDGTLYIGSNDGNLYALRPDGTRRWTKSFGANAPASNSPALAADGTIYIKPGDGWLYALNPADGTTRWRFNVGALQSYASPSVAPDGTIYQGSDNGRLYAINPNGTEKWRYPAATSGPIDPIYTVPALDGAGNLYFGVLNSGRLYSLTPAGTLRWIYTGATLDSSSSPALSPDGATVYFGGYDRRLHAVNASTGGARWTFLLGDEVRASSPAVDSNGVIYIGAYDYKLYAINANGTLKRTWDTGDWIRSSPAISGQTLYLGSNDDKLYAFNIGASSAGPWAQYRQNVQRTGRAFTSTPEILSAPRAIAAVIGENVQLDITTTGTPPFTYQWFNDGQIIPGATAAGLSIPNISQASAGNYNVRVTSSDGLIVTASTAVTVRAPTEAAAPGRLINLSVRTTAGTGSQTLIVGFFLTGSPAKSLLIRAVGPTLGTAFGITGVVEDPRLQLLSGTNVIATNEDWFRPTAGGPGSAVASVFSATGAFPLGENSRDSAIVQAINSGPYTAQVTGATNVGIVLAELYDTTPNTGARLANVSARSQVNTGSDILIAGFSISGNVPKTVVIRGVGPSLNALGVSGTLTDPVLALYKIPSSPTGLTVKLDENNDWGGNDRLLAAFAQVGAFPMASPGSRDAAMVVTLVPGNYTAQVSGAGGTTGVALVEVYELP